MKLLETIKRCLKRKKENETSAHNSVPPLEELDTPANTERLPDATGEDSPDSSSKEADAECASGATDAKEQLDASTDPDADDDQLIDVKSKMKWLSEAFDKKEVDKKQESPTSNSLIADRKKWIDEHNKKQSPVLTTQPAPVASINKSSLISDRMKWVESEIINKGPLTSTVDVRDEVGSLTISDRLKSFNEKKHWEGRTSNSLENGSEKSNSNALISDRLAWIEAENQRAAPGGGLRTGNDMTAPQESDGGLVSDRLKWLQEEREKGSSQTSESLPSQSSQTLVADRLKWLGDDVDERHSDDVMDDSVLEDECVTDIKDEL